MIWALALRNLWRRPQRTILSFLSIAIVAALLVFMLSFQVGVYETMKQSTLRIFDGYAQLQPPGYQDDPRLDRTITKPEHVADLAQSIPGISAAAPRVNGFAILANGGRSYAAAVVGVDPADEAKISTIGHVVHEGRYLEASDTDAAVIGAGLARNLALKVGDKVTLLGSGKDGSVAADVLVVKGIYASGVPELDRSILEMPYQRAVDTFAMDGSANTIALGGNSLASVNAALPELDGLAKARHLALLDWGQLEPSLRDTIDLKYATAMAFYFTLVAVVAFIILNTLLMSVLERTREFGMLLAIGMRPSQIGLMVWAELLLLAFIGTLAGFAIGAGFTIWLEQVGVTIPQFSQVLAQFGLPERLYPDLDLFTGLFGPVVIFGAILLGGLIPFARVLSLTAAQAMRAP
jgi:ABC-type lipoprotein release transport system permease subunit